jgi:hypothetical protein
MPERLTYVIEKYAGVVPNKNRWRVSTYRHDDGSGAVIGYYPTRKAAILSARLLAGHTSTVQFWRS